MKTSSSAGTLHVSTHIHLSVGYESTGTQNIPALYLCIESYGGHIQTDLIIQIYLFMKVLAQIYLKFCLISLKFIKLKMN